jgi:hypothetical protein
MRADIWKYNTDRQTDSRDLLFMSNFYASRRRNNSISKEVNV